MCTAVVLALATVVTLLTNAATTERRSLSIPDVAGEFTRFETVSGTQLAALVSGGAFITFDPDDIRTARAAIYNRGSDRTPSLIFVGFLASDSPTIGAQLRRGSATDVVNEVLTGSGTSSSTTVDAGPLGGAMRVADVTVDNSHVVAGVWADHDTLGVLLDYADGAGPSTLAMARITRTLRAAAEH